MIPVTVGIPEGCHCIQGLKPCIFARYTKKWNAFNCTLHHKILKGEQAPRKCKECLNYCKQKGEEAHEQNKD